MTEGVDKGLTQKGVIRQVLGAGGMLRGQQPLKLPAGDGAATTGRDNDGGP